MTSSARRPVQRIDLEPLYGAIVCKQTQHLAPRDSVKHLLPIGFGITSAKAIFLVTLFRGAEANVTVLCDDAVWTPNSAPCSLFVSMVSTRSSSTTAPSSRATGAVSRKRAAPAQRSSARAKRAKLDEGDTASDTSDASSDEDSDCSTGKENIPQPTTPRGRRAANRATAAVAHDSPPNGALIVSRVVLSDAVYPGRRTRTVSASKLRQNEDLKSMLHGLCMKLI